MNSAIEGNGIYRGVSSNGVLTIVFVKKGEPKSSVFEWNTLKNKETTLFHEFMGNTEKFTAYKYCLDMSPFDFN